MAKTYNLDFQGYWQDKNKGGLPKEPGVYAVYKGTLQNDNLVTLEKIVYIGEAEDIHDRHNLKEHEHYKDFVRVCGGADKVWYNAAKVLGGKDELLRVENALIYKIKPEINDKEKDSFNYQTTTVVSTGRHSFIPNSYTVNPT